MNTQDGRTIAQKLGLEVGDHIKLLDDSSFAFEKGSIVELTLDDGTENPYFSAVPGKSKLCSGYEEFEETCTFCFTLTRGDADGEPVADTNWVKVERRS